MVLLAESWQEAIVPWLFGCWIRLPVQLLEKMQSVLGSGVQKRDVLPVESCREAIVFPS
jgi:hypothetical protein